MNYFENISNIYGWLKEAPKKADVLNNAKIEGKNYILNDSNNRAIVTESDNALTKKEWEQFTEKTI